MTRLASVGPSGREVAAVIVGDDDDLRAVPVSELPGCHGLPLSLRALLAGEHIQQVVAASQDVASDAGASIEDVRCGPPIVDPQKVLCIGLNYRSHADEQGREWPKQPLVFAKLSSALTGAYDDIRLPAADPTAVDFEVELALIIGSEARSVAAEDAMAVVAGYMVANDVTQRRWQKHDGQWTRAKGCDTFLPCGPWMVTSDTIADYRDLRLRTAIGGVTYQDGTAADLIHDIPTLLAYITRDITLHAGDIICTGTPAGVGCYQDPKRFLAAGDMVECMIDGIGVLRNPVVAPE